MTITRIRQLGDPILRVRCELVKDTRAMATRLVVADLRETLRDFRERHGFGRGIAAPQIGAPLRIAYVEMQGEELVLINPEIVDVGHEDFEVWDDCFSFPDLYVRVMRAHHIRVRYLDLEGAPRELEAVGDRAELLQHELDHLDGVLAVDRATGPDPFCLRSEWTRRYAAAGRYGPPVPRAFDYVSHPAELGSPG